MGRDLVLLTHQYPHATGDASFVEAEISSLAKGFDRVIVWTLTPSSARLMRTPSNLEFAGSLVDRPLSSPILLAQGALHLPTFLRLILSEIRSRRGAIRVGRLVRSAALAIVGGRRLDAWLREYGTEGLAPVLYSFWGTDCALTMLSLSTAPKLIAVRVHGYDLYEERVGYLPFRRPLFELADLMLTVSKHGLDYLAGPVADDYELPPVVVARLGTADYGPGPGAPSDVVRIVSCSSLIALKRVGAIFDVVNSLAAGRKVHWVHFGDGPLRAELETKLAGKSENLIAELRGTVGRSEILDYYGSTQISAFVNLSTTEGLPVSIMEALSFGIPVIATDVGGTGEIVGRQLGSGVLVPPDASCAEFIAAIAEVIDAHSSWKPRHVWDELCNADKNGHMVADLLSDSDRNNGR